MDMLLFLTAAVHIFCTPFTKVEESFNIQAMHDILYLRHNFTQYDHHEFPGVVPRTFLGALFISISSTPFILLFETINISKFWAQYVVRLVLAAVVTIAWSKLKCIITKIYGSKVSLWFSVITLTQFHFIFYMSRTLPNIMALPIVLYALAYWLNGQSNAFIIWSGIAILVFRFELIIFLGLLLLSDLLFKKITIERILKIVVPAALIILTTSVVVDSFFWRRLLWPEGEVLWYNTVLNKSSNWGTSPFLWYFYSALPRAMGASLLFVPFGLIFERRVRLLVLVAIGFVLIYSILPHKELRFIIYVFPVLNLSAATICHRFWSNSSKSLWHKFLALCAGGHLVANILITLFLLMVSRTNYPGGVALRNLHMIEAQTTNVSVHISNLAAQSGVTRFLQIRDDWRYCKNEYMNYTKKEIVEYTHLLMEAKNKLNAQLWLSLQEDFETMEFVNCFSSIGIQYNSIMPVKIKTKPCLVILKKKLKIISPQQVTKTSKEKEEKKLGKSENFNEPLLTKETKKYKRSRENKENIKKDPKLDEPKKSKKEKKLTNESQKNNEFGSYIELRLNEDSLPLNKKDMKEATEKLVNDANETIDQIIRSTSSDTENQTKDLSINVSETQSNLFNLLNQDVSLEDDVIVSTVESNVDLPTLSEEESESALLNKEINFQELYNLARGHTNHKTRVTKLKIRKIIEQYYRSKGKYIENDSIEHLEKKPMASSKKHSVKTIIKQERIKEMIVQISTMDLTKICNLEKMSTKDCLKLVIDKIDENDHHESS